MIDEPYSHKNRFVHTIMFFVRRFIQHSTGLTGMPQKVANIAGIK